MGGRFCYKLMICCLFASLLVGCGSNADYSKNASSAIVSDNSNTEMEEAVYEMGFADEKATTVTASENSEDGIGDSNYFQNSQRKLIKTVDLELETQSYASFVEQLIGKIESLGGYTQSYTTQGHEGYRYAHIVARIPKEKIDTFLNTIEGNANIIYRREYIDDITLNYVDTKSRRDMLQEEQKRLMELMEQASDIDDIIAIEERMTEVSYQLESLESQLRTYDNKIDFSTVNIDIEEVMIYTPIKEQSFIEKIKEGFMENLSDVWKWIQDIIVYIITHIPAILVSLFVMFLFVTLLKKFRYKHTKKNHMEKKP